MPLSNSVNDKESGGGGFAVNGPFEIYAVDTMLHDFKGSKSKGPAAQLRIVGFKSADQPSNDPTVLYLSCSSRDKVLAGYYDPQTGQERALDAEVPGGNCFSAAPGVELKGIPESTKAAKFLFSLEGLLARAVGLYSELNRSFITLKTVKEKSEFTEKDADFGVEKKEQRDIEYTYAQQVHYYGGQGTPLWKPHENVTIPEGKGTAKKKGAKEASRAAAMAPPMAPGGVPSFGAPAMAAPPSFPAVGAPAVNFAPPAAPQFAAPSAPSFPAAPSFPSAPMAPPAMAAPAAPPMMAPPMAATAPAINLPAINESWRPWADEIAKRILTKARAQGQAALPWEAIQSAAFTEIQADQQLMASGGLKEIMGIYIHPGYRSNPQHVGWVEQNGLCALQ